MNTARRLWADLTSEEYRFAVLLGIAVIPVVLVENLVLGMPATNEPLMATGLGVACLVAGWVYERREGEPMRAGVVTALVGGSVLVVWSVFQVLTGWWGNPTLVDALGETGMAVATGLAVIMVVFFMLAILVVVGIVAGIIGGKLRTVGRETGVAAHQ